MLEAGRGVLVVPLWMGGQWYNIFVWGALCLTMEGLRALGRGGGCLGGMVGEVLVVGFGGDLDEGGF